MKKLLLSVFALMAITISVNAQIIARGISPAAIVGNKPFTWADDWGQTPNFNVPGTWVQDTLAICEDGTPGMSNTTIPHPLSQEGCGPLTNASSIAGKIAVLYRGTCNFSTKALNAQNAGAVAVIIINRDPDPVGMAGGADGALITIPVVMIGSGPGQAITNEMLNGPVVMFLGNKAGLLPHDLTVKTETTLSPPSQGVLSQWSQNGSEFNFDMGCRVYNFGSTTQTGVSINAKITNPSGAVVYNNTAIIPSIVPNDSADVLTGGTYSLPNFSLASYPNGLYTIVYTATADSTDLSNEDNVITKFFNINDSIHTYASIDPATGLPEANGGGVRSASYTSTWSACNFMQNPNASRVGVQGLYFNAVSSKVNYDFTGEEMLVSLIKWDDPYTVAPLLPDAGTFDNLLYVAQTTYSYTGDFQDSMVYAAFENPVLLTNNDKYLLCVQTTTDSSNISINNSVSYLFNEELIPFLTCPLEVDGAFDARNFSSKRIFAIGAKVFDAAELSIDKTDKLYATVYPNPADDNVSIRLNVEGTANLIITDITGKVISNSTLTLDNGATTVDVTSLAQGAYVFRITAANGSMTNINIIKR